MVTGYRHANAAYDTRHAMATVLGYVPSVEVNVPTVHPPSNRHSTVDDMTKLKTHVASSAAKPTAVNGFHAVRGTMALSR